MKPHIKGIEFKLLRECLEAVELPDPTEAETLLDKVLMSLAESKVTQSTRKH